MIRNKAQIQEYLLRKLKETAPSVQEAALVSTEGLLILSTVTDPDNAERLAAITGTTARQFERACADLHLGEAQFGLATGSTGSLYLRKVDEGTILAVLVEAKADWTVLQREVRRTAGDLRRVAAMMESVTQT